MKTSPFCYALYECWPDGGIHSAHAEICRQIYLPKEQFLTPRDKECLDVFCVEIQQLYLKLHQTIQHFFKIRQLYVLTHIAEVPSSNFLDSGSETVRSWNSVLILNPRLCI